MSADSGRRLGVESVVLHLLTAAVVGVAWWWLAPELTYTVFEGQAFVVEEARYTTIFGGDATFTMLGAVAGVVCAAALLLRGYRGPVLAVVLTVLGTLGSVFAWWLAVTLGPGRLDDIAAAAGEGDVLAGPELNAYASGLVWPMVAVATVFVVTAFSEPERTRPRRLRRSAE